MFFADPYTFHARTRPALIVVLPLGFLMSALLPGQPFFVTAFFGLLGTAGGTALVAQMARDRGRDKVPALWKGWDGPPTTRFLRHRRSPSDRVPDGLRPQLEELIGYSLPSREEERSDPTGADLKYEEVVGFLREATRDNSRFPLVFAENVNYGLRRNLWGLKPYGVVIAILAASCSWTLFTLSLDLSCFQPWLDTIIGLDDPAKVRLVVSVANTAFAAF